MIYTIVKTSISLCYTPHMLDENGEGGNDAPWGISDFLDLKNQLFLSFHFGVRNWNRPSMLITMSMKTY